jgi:hypothetical protein
MKAVIWIGLLLVWGTSAAVAGDRTLLVGSEGDDATEMRREATFGGSACPPIDDFTSAHPNRIDAELLILCNALREGGPPVRLQLVSEPNYSRGLAEAIAGRLDLPSQTIWSSELDEHADTLLRSLPVVQAGEWQVGLYTTENRSDVLAVTTVEQMRGLTAATPRSWVEDWRALSAIHPKELIDVQNNDGIFPMIQAGRADFTLFTFSTEPDFGWRPTYKPDPADPGLQGGLSRVAALRGRPHRGRRPGAAPTARPGAHPPARSGCDKQGVRTQRRFRATCCRLAVGRQQLKQARAAPAIVTIRGSRSLRASLCWKELDGHGMPTPRRRGR